MPGIKHLVECHCVLSLYKTGEDLINHKFPVYSKIDKQNKLVPRLVKCNNCDTMHYVSNICQSEIRPGKDQSELSISVDELCLMLPERLSSALTKIKTDISNWEHIVDIFDENRWGEQVVLRRDVIDEKQHVKIIEVTSEKTFKLSNQVISDLIGK